MTARSRFSLSAATLLLLAFADVIVLERIYKPLAAAYDVPWSELSAGLKWAPEILWWHVAFIPLAIGVFLLVGISGRDWRFFTGGLVLFLTGWEDTLYYVLLRQVPPARLPWLDRAWGIAWTRLFEGGQSVSRFGLFAANIVGLALAYVVFRKGTADTSGRASARR